MKIYQAVSVYVILLLIFSRAAAQADEDIPIDVRNLSNRAIVLRVTDNPGGTNVTAIASQKGLVVIDTEMSFTIASEIKKAIEKEFGRNDFAYVINTHHHWDHTNGNQAFSDAVIVGHDRCTEEMRKFDEGKRDFADRLRTGWISELENNLEALDPHSEEAKTIRKRIYYSSTVCKELEDEFVLNPPSLTFNDRMTLILGDVTIELIYYGINHTISDILIHVPEEKLLVVGDQFGRSSLPYVPEEADVEKWLVTFESLLDGDNAVEKIVPGHDGIMTTSDLREQRDYIKDLREQVAAALKEGMSLEETKERLSFEKRFSPLSHLRHVWGNGEDYHLKNIENLWAMMNE